MHICICVCVYIYICVYVYIYYICICIYIYIYIYIIYIAADMEEANNIVSSSSIVEEHIAGAMLTYADLC